jgi:hypothetical protein
MQLQAATGLRRGQDGRCRKDAIPDPADLDDE